MSASEAVIGLTERERSSLAARGIEVVSELALLPGELGHSQSQLLRVDLRSSSEPAVVAVVLVGEVEGARTVDVVRPGGSATALPVMDDLGALLTSRLVRLSPVRVVSNADYVRLREAASRVDLPALASAVEAHLDGEESLVRYFVAESATAGLLAVARGVEPDLLELDLDRTLRYLEAIADGAPLEWVLRRVGGPS